MSEIFNVIFGEYTFIQLFGYAWFLIIGYIIYGLNEATGRDVQSSHTPKKWNWKFWINDNWRRYLVTILTTYIMFRFYVEFVGHEFTNFEALMMGLIGDGIGATAKQRVSAVKADREKLMTTYAADEVIADNKIIADDIKADQEFIADELKAKQEIDANHVIADNKTIADELKG